MRRTSSTAVVLLGFASLMSAPDAAAREGKFFSAQINYVVADVDGGGRTGGDASTAFSLGETLGITDADGFPEANLWFNFGDNSILLSYYASNYHGGALLAADLVFEETFFPAGTPVDSQFSFALGRLHYNYRFVDNKLIDFGLLAGADLYTVRGDVSASSALHGSTDFNAPFPVVGFNLAVKPPLGFRVYLEASGMADVGDVDGSVLDAQARLTWYILDGPFGITAGYRFLDADVDVAGDGEGSVEQSGYYGGVSLRF